MYDSYIKTVKVKNTIVYTQINITNIRIWGPKGNEHTEQI